MSDEKMRKTRNTNVGTAALVTANDNDSDCEEGEETGSEGSSEVALVGCIERRDKDTQNEEKSNILGWYVIEPEEDEDLMRDWVRLQKNETQEEPI